MANTDFIDEVILCDGRSTDKTIHLHLGVEKLKIIKGPQWDIKSWTWENLRNSQNRLLHYFNEHDNKNVISLLFSADTIFTEEFRDELRFNIELLINSPQSNWAFLPYSKTLNYAFRTRVYNSLGKFFVVSMLKFTNHTRWHKYGIHETSIIGNSSPKQLVFRGPNLEWKDSIGEKHWTQLEWQYAPISYDMFMFTKQNVADKLNRYVTINKELSDNRALLDPDAYIKNSWLPTALKMHIIPMNENESSHRGPCVVRITRISTFWSFMFWAYYSLLGKTGVYINEYSSTRSWQS